MRLNEPERAPEPRPEPLRGEVFVQTAASVGPSFPDLAPPVPVLALRGPGNLSDDQLLGNLLTTDYQGVAFKRECLLRVLEDEGLQARLLEKLQGGGS